MGEMGILCLCVTVGANISMRERLITVVKTFGIGILLWGTGSFTTMWLLSTIEGIYHFFTEGYSKMGLSFLGAVFYIIPLLFQGVLGVPFLLAYAFRWGILYYWYTGGILSGVYLVACREFRLRPTHKLELALVIMFLQTGIYILLGNPIDYRSVSIGEHLAYYIMPMVAGTLLTYYYALRQR